LHGQLTRVYVDTSVVVALADVEDEFHLDSTRFLHNLRNRGILTSIGPPFMLEVAKTAELRDSPAASRLVKTVDEYGIELTPALDDWLWNLLDEYLSRKVLGVGRLMDLMHYASATLLRCDYVASWDKEHFNERVAMKVNQVNSSAGLANLISGDPIAIARYLGLG
jgi:predicted nucleic acid-binding protein